MRCRLGMCCTFLILTGQLLAQVIGPGAGAGTGPAAESKLPMDTPVITMKGYCDSTIGKNGGAAAAKAAADCTTVITRAQFEKLSEATQPAFGPAPPVPPTRNYLLAHRYPDVLILSQKAKELGMDKDPKFQERLRYAELQILADFMRKHLEDQAQQVSDAEVAKYYKEYPEEFEEIGLLRIYVPKTKQHAPDPDMREGEKVDPVADEAEMKAVAQKIAKEAAAGGAFEKLEAEAYDAAGEHAVPGTDVGKTLRNELPSLYEKAIFDLPVGKVSDLVEGPNGWYIVKVSSKETLPLDRARGIMVSQRMKKSMEAIEDPVKIDLNLDYFEKQPR